MTDDQPQQPPVSVHVSQQPAPEPGFTVTLRDVYEGVSAKLDEMSSKLDRMSNLPADVKELQASVREIDRNYVSKASVRWWFSATCAVIVAAAALVGVIVR